MLNPTRYPTTLGCGRGSPLSVSLQKKGDAKGVGFCGAAIVPGTLPMFPLPKPTIQQLWTHMRNKDDCSQQLDTNTYKLTAMLLTFN